MNLLQLLMNKLAFLHIGPNSYAAKSDMIDLFMQRDLSISLRPNPIEQ